MQDDEVSTVRRAGEVDPRDAPFLTAMEKQWAARAPSWPGGSPEPGASNEDRARWLLDFAIIDLHSLSVDDWKKLAGELAAFLTPAGTMLYSSRARELQPRGVRGLQRWLRKGLLMLSFTQTFLWQITRNEVVVLQWTRRQGLGHYTVRQDQVGAAGEVFRAAVATLLTAVSARFRFCGQCRRPFVGHKRQTYCTSQCSQATRTRRFRTKQAKSVATRSNPK